MNLTKVFNEKQLTAINFNGEPVFIAKQVCDILGIVNTPQFTADLNEKQKIVLEGEKLKAFKALLERDSNLAVSTTYDQNTLNKTTVLTILTEQGLYKALLRSRKPEAEKIQTWITDEVLPAIRKTGKYDIADKVKSKLEAPKDVRTPGQRYQDAAVLCEGSLNLYKLIGSSESTAKAQAVIAVRRTYPEIDLTPALENNRSTIQDRFVTASDIGKVYGYTGAEMNREFQKAGFLKEDRDSKGKLEWRLTEFSKGLKLAEYFDTGKKRSDGMAIQQIKWRYDLTTTNYVYSLL